MLSVIIPTLNEALSVPRTIPHTRRAAGTYPIEIIISDCDSSDGTLRAAAECGAISLSGSTSRADAMNRGAAGASGDVLLFLHADTLLPDHFPQRIEKAMRQPQIVGGAFEFAFARPHNHALQLVAVCNRIRYRWTGNYYGDQAIFVRRQVFQRIGGFPRIALFEDQRFAHAMNRLGKTAILSPPVRTSPRRFIDNGILKQLARDTLLLACDNFGIGASTLWTRYNGFNRGAV
jgi:rSAM/selenodomain-associated transferase 2